MLSIIPLRIAIATKQCPHPQAIFILGGELIRISQGAIFAQQHPLLPVWVSSTSAQVRAISRILSQAGIQERVKYDKDARDTVTNFTNMVVKFGDRHICHVYLVTSDYHLTRSKAIAFFIFGSRGIIVTPIATISSRPPESWFKTFRDSLRSLVWLVTGLA